MEAARELLRLDASNGNVELLEAEREAAIATLRELDRHHLERLRALDAEFEDQWRPSERAAVAAQRRELARVLAGCQALCMAGGHVGVLLDRLRLFGLAEMVSEMPIIAWSAGAMVLSERIVVFHDSPPQGAGNAEVLAAGLGVCRDVVALPHASKRLRLSDPAGLALFARRFHPDLCVLLDPRTRLDGDGRSWSAQPGTLKLSERGTAEEIGSR
jgi:hypothetical protein